MFNFNPIEKLISDANDRDVVNAIELTARYIANVMERNDIGNETFINALKELSSHAFKRSLQIFDQMLEDLGNESPILKEVYDAHFGNDKRAI